MSLSRSHRDDPPIKAEMNVVPLVDVALVLLVIFMVTATFVKSSVMKLELPAGSRSARPPARAREIVIEIDRSGAFALNGAKVTDAALHSGLDGDSRAWGTGVPVTVRGDSRAAYGRIVRAMSLAQDAGYTHLRIATQAGSEESGDAGR